MDDDELLDIWYIKDKVVWVFISWINFKFRQMVNGLDPWNKGQP